MTAPNAIQDPGAGRVVAPLPAGWDRLPLWPYSNDATFGADVDRLAAEVFAQPHRGLWRTGGEGHDGYGNDSGLVAVTNSDLRRLMVHPALSNVPADVLSGPLISPQEGRDASGYYRCFEHSVFTKQPPIHGPSKKLFARQLTAGALDGYAGLVASLIRDRLHELAELDGCDFRRDFAEPVVARFWAEVLGLSHAESVRVSELAVALQKANDFRLSEDGRREINQAGAAFFTEFGALLRRGIESGEVAFLQRLAADFRAMSDEERPSCLEAHFGVSLIDGLHTLPAAMVSALYPVAQSPASLAALRDDPTLVEDAFLESARLHSGIVSTQRYAVSAFEFDGIEVPEGTLIMMMWLLGNRDPEVYERPEVFRLGRGHRSDATFGGGAYICPGRNIAKLFCHLTLVECTRPGVEVTFTTEPEWSTASAIHEPMRAPVRIRVGAG